MYIYLINQNDTSLYKIGISKDIEKRLKSLQTGSGISLILMKSFLTTNSFKLESSLHAYYKLKKVNSEWFELTLEDVEGFLNVCEKQENNLNILKENNTYLSNF